MEDWRWKIPMTTLILIIIIDNFKKKKGEVSDILVYNWDIYKLKEFYSE
jgi:hypothetical protein